jgi:hypothetical protein
MKYLIDSNTFIEAARTFYSFDYGTKFWDFLELQAINNALASIDKVLEKLIKVTMRSRIGQMKNF